jgi:hypothetical protein
MAGIEASHLEPPSAEDMKVDDRDWDQGVPRVSFDRAHIRSRVSMPYESGCPNPVWDGSSCPIHDWSLIYSTEFPLDWHGLHYEIYVKTMAYIGHRNR